jgi:uncharacterized protein
MAGTVHHFAIHADDLGRAMAFYGAVFGWTFEPWGPPDFFQIKGAGMAGALEKRQTPLSGEGIRAFEVTVSVDDLAATQAAVLANGGKITMTPFRIPTVGELIWIEDTEGNRVGAMKYEAGA